MCGPMFEKIVRQDLYFSSDQTGRCHKVKFDNLVSIMLILKRLNILIELGKEEEDVVIKDL